MISTKKLVKMAKKWQKFAATQRRRILLPKDLRNMSEDRFSSSAPTTSSTKADHECFTVYSSDQLRFKIPLNYLNNEIFKELLHMSEEEFGLPSEGTIILPQNSEGLSISSRSSLPSVAEKGHFVAYTADGKRYSIPISYLQSSIFRELFKMSEEEYGIGNGGPITFPCDSIFIDYMISLSQRKTTKDVEEALLLSIDAYRRWSSCTVHQQETSHRVLVF